MTAAALPWTLAGFALLAISFFGWGRFAARLLGTSASGRTDGAVTIFLGWAFSLLILQLLNFVFPINALISIPLFVAGLIMSLSALRSYGRRLTREPIPRSLIATAILFALIALWVAARGLYPLENFDSGLYHLPTIRWTSTYPIVPGLGNLHGRLAFNQSFFTYAAAINAALFRGHNWGAANGFLILVLLLQAVQGLWAHSRNRDSASESFPLTWAANLFVLPVIAYLALSSDGMTSPTPDLGAALIELAMFLMFVRGVGEWKAGGEPQHFAATVLPLLAVTAITVKLSTIAFAGSLIAACVLYEIHASYRDTKVLRRTALRLVPPAIVAIVWVVRGIILSGCPVYPTTVGCTSVDWMIPKDKIVNEANWVYSWAREPGVHWRLVLGDWNWMQAWMTRESRDVIGLIFPLAAAAALVVIAVLVRRSARRKTQTAPGYSDLLVMIPIALGIAFWFFTAPDPRFGRAFFWMMSISAGLALLVSLQPLLDKRQYRRAVIALAIVLNAPFLGYIAFKSGPRLARISVVGWQPVPMPLVAAKATDYGLTLFVPMRGERCWNSPIPCTPYFNPDLALRVPGHMEMGFIDRSPLGRLAAPPSPRE